jgi:SEC-C motif domain protein
VATRDECPCGLGEGYDACCGRYHRGEADPPTAELLMRSRFTAFAVGDGGYLLSSWHPTTMPRRVPLDPAQRWTRLDIVARSGGGLFDQEGTVSFRAHYTLHGQPGVLAELSRFARDGGRWRYLDGQATPTR